MHAEQGDIWHANEGPFLTGPELDDRTLLGGFCGRIKIGKADTAQVGSQADQDVPCTMKIRKVNRRPHLTENPVADPAQQSQSPPET